MFCPVLQDVLVVGIGNSVLRINTTNVGKIGALSELEPLNCPVDKMIDGVELVGNHDGEVTDLSMCTTCLVSSSLDGTVSPSSFALVFNSLLYELVKYFVPDLLV